MSTVGGARRFLAAHQLGVDIALAAFLLLLWYVGQTLTTSPTGAADAETPLPPLIAVLGVLPVLLRRWVVPALVFCVPLLALIPILVKSAGPERLTVLVLIGAVATLRPTRQAMLATVAVIVASSVSIMVVPAGSRLGSWISWLILLAAAYVTGVGIAGRRASIHALAERARLAEQSRELVTRQAVLTERHLIASELNDLLAHHISAMKAMAAGARRTVHDDPDLAEQALVSLEETGRTTLRQMRRMLDVLRSDAERSTAANTGGGDGTAGIGSSAPIAPLPGQAGIEELVARFRRDGLPVTISGEGSAPELDSGVDLTVFRIVQEALTNAAKHAGPTQVRVSLRYEPDAVQVAVVDSGPGRSGGSDPRGRGLLGIRERVDLYGGQLYVGSAPGGGFAVRARIPYDRPPAKPAEVPRQPRPQLSLDPEIPRLPPPLSTPPSASPSSSPSSSSRSSRRDHPLAQ